MVTARSATLAVALSLTACTVVLGAESTQCKTTGDCRNRGGAFSDAVCVNDVCRSPDESRWKCLDTQIAPATGATDTIEATLDFYNPVRPTEPLQNIAVRACNRLDVKCDKPASKTLASDARGHLTLTLPTGFDGYLEMNSAITVPAIWFFSPKPVTDAIYRIGLLSPASFAEIAKTAGGTIDNTRGHSFHFALDCGRTFGTFAPGVGFSAEPVLEVTRPFYLANGLPSTSASQTDASGVGGFANLPPGVVTVRGKVASTARASGSISVLVRAGTITYAAIAPGG